jgi:hypothetical protein
VERGPSSDELETSAGGHAVAEVLALTVAEHHDNPLEVADSGAHDLAHPEGLDRPQALDGFERGFGGPSRDSRRTSADRALGLIAEVDLDLAVVGNDAHGEQPDALAQGTGRDRSGAVVDFDDDGLLEIHPAQLGHALTELVDCLGPRSENVDDHTIAVVAEPDADHVWKPPQLELERVLSLGGHRLAFEA